MSRLVAEYADPEALRRALRRVAEDGHRGLDAFTPFPVEGIADDLHAGPNRVRPAMLLAGLGAALFAFLFQWWSSVLAYPLNSGGRPLNSWPVFLLVPFEVGILAAGIAGFVAFLVGAGLPRLHHPLFDVPGFERATQDRYFLLVGTQESRLHELRALLEASGAGAVTEVRP